MFCRKSRFPRQGFRHEYVRLFSLMNDSLGCRFRLSHLLVLPAPLRAVAAPKRPWPRKRGAWRSAHAPGGRLPEREQPRATKKTRTGREAALWSSAKVRTRSRSAQRLPGLDAATFASGLLHTTGISPHRGRRFPVTERIRYCAQSALHRPGRFGRPRTEPLCEADAGSMRGVCRAGISFLKKNGVVGAVLRHPALFPLPVLMGRGLG